VEITKTRVWKSANEYSSLGVLDDLYITVPRGSYDSLVSTLNIPAVIEAPVAQSQPLAEINISLGDDELLKAPLRALDDNPSGSFWQRTSDGVSLWIE
jgi:D-alanyl-D-alanine carboxypeptidase (penicillin-binding protein 5/6)